MVWGKSKDRLHQSFFDVRIHLFILCGAVFLLLLLASIGQATAQTQGGQGSINIIKSTNFDSTFSFTGTNGIADFDITTSGLTGSNLIDNLPSGSYTITESANSGFSLDNIECDVEFQAVRGPSDPKGTHSGIINIDIPNRQVTIEIQEAENVECTFTNSALPGSITIEKQSDVTGSFDFSGTGAIGSFTLTPSPGSPASNVTSGLDAGTYTVTETATPDFDLIDISCSGDADNGTVIDLAGRQATIDLDPGESIICTFTSQDNFDEDKFRDDSMRAAKGFAYRRARAMLSSEPDRVSFVRRNPDVLWGGADGAEAKNKPVRYAMNVSEGAAQLDVAAATGRTETSNGIGGVELWIEGSFTKADDDISGVAKIDSQYSVVHFGADIQVTENIIIGALASIDRAKEDVDTFDGTTAFKSQEVDGNGWMAGPYLSARLSENLFFNTRFAVGLSQNDLTIPGVVSNDEFETGRALARASLSGNQNFGEDGKWRFTPTASISYFKENLKRYTSKTGVEIPSQSLTLGRAEFEPEIGYRHQTARGTVIEPQLSVAAVWDFDAPDNLAVQGITFKTDDFRGRVEGGVQVNWEGGTSARLSAAYDGIGSSNFDAYSIDAWMDFPFNKPKPRAVRRAPIASPSVQYKECPDGTRVPVMDDCLVVLVETYTPEPIEFIIYFDFDKDDLLPSEASKIDDAVARSLGHELDIIVLEGNTDRAGSENYNDELSVRRALTVRNALIERGIDRNKLRFDAFGENNPAVPTNDGVALRANRRTEVLIRFN